MIEVKNLVKRYGDNLAVDHLNFTVEDGQVYGFLGPNGAGKSTTMNIMTGYLAATEGQVLINGHDIAEEPKEAKRCIGYLPELPPLYPEMTVLEYLKFVARLKNIPKAEQSEHLAEIMDTTKIADMKNRLIKNLSKGYKQRVGLAQALIGYPDIIILDEPTVGLDPKQIIETRTLIKSLAQKHTVILSSHILSEVSAVCDKILIISHGRLAACDTPENLERQNQGAMDIRLVIRGNADTVKGALKSCGSIDYIETVDINTETGLGTYVVHSNDETDIREKIFYSMVQINCPILEMTVSVKSLEDVFLALTSDGAAMSIPNETETETDAAAEDNETEADATDEYDEADAAADDREEDVYDSSI